MCNPAIFIFCSEDGVISGWNQTVSGTAASILYDHSSTGAVYKGCAVTGTAEAPYLFAANFNAGTVDVYDGCLNLNPTAYKGAFANPMIPAGSAPWGMAIAPANFGPFAGALLVGNFSDGKINAFNVATGALLGTLNDPTGNPIAIPGLWALDFGGGAQDEDPGTLYITAGTGYNNTSSKLTGCSRASRRRPSSLPPAFKTAQASSANRSLPVRLCR
jgi:hypothetical protein